MKRMIAAMLLGTMLLGGCGQVEVQETSSSVSEAETDMMQRFPSYDWGAEDNDALAYVAANTPGSGRNKQEAVIDVLNYVWYNNKNHMSVSDYVYRNYDGYTQPTEYHYDLVYKVILGEWAED